MKSFAVALLFSFISLQVQALEYGCQLKPNQLKTVGTRFVKDAAYNKKSLPNSITITSEFSGEWFPTAEADKNTVDATVEGFFRPEIDDYYSVVPFPVLGVSLTRERNVIYICAHADPDPRKTHFTAYMMRGFHLDRPRLENFFGDIFSEPRLEVKPLAASLLGISEIRKKFLFWLGWFPLFDEGIKVTEGLQRFIANIIGDFTGIGVERITLTREYIEIASGIDLNRPTKAKLIRKIQIGAPEGK